MALLPSAMAGPATRAAGDPPTTTTLDPLTPGSATLGRDTLYGVIGALAQGPELSRVLPAIVDLLTEATACHACFVYLIDGDRLVMRAASSIYAASVDRVSFGVDEGISGWVVRHDEPVFLRDNALSDPRNIHVSELEEERFQSMVAVPLRGRERSVIGVIVLHTEPPGEFGQEVRDLLMHVASLVAGAIENARLFERERERARLTAELASLVQQMAAVTERAELWRVACDGALALLGAERCRLLLVTGSSGAQRVVARSGVDPEAGADAPPIDAPARGRLATQLSAGDTQLGVLSVEREAPFGQAESDVMETISGQLAVALRTLDLIERLTEENLVRDLFEAIAEGRADRLAGRARSARVNPDRPYVVAAVEPLVPRRVWERAEQVEARLRRVAPGALCDLGTERLRVLLPVSSEGSTLGEELDRIDAELARIASEERVAAGRSSLQPRLAADPASLAEAIGAVRIARALDDQGGARAWDSLGAYRYLAGVGPEIEPDARHGRAIAALWDYDERRGSELIQTLERYLSDRRIVPTARALFIHPNTLRQRLERAESLTGLVIADEDPLSLELAIKLHRLRAPERTAD